MSTPRVDKVGLTHKEMGIDPLQFTPGQLRDTVGLSVETFRHWMRVLPPFAVRKGSSLSFTIGDLLAASILRRLSDGCGVRVGHLKEISKRIVSLRA